MTLCVISFLVKIFLVAFFCVLSKVFRLLPSNYGHLRSIYRNYGCWRLKVWNRLIGAFVNGINYIGILLRVNKAFRLKWVFDNKHHSYIKLIHALFHEYSLSFLVSFRNLFSNFLFANCISNTSSTISRVVNVGTSSKMCQRNFVPTPHPGTLEIIPTLRNE